jgi:hypothetical protein
MKAHSLLLTGLLLPAAALFLSSCYYNDAYYGSSYGSSYSSYRSGYPSGYYSRPYYYGGRSYTSRYHYEDYCHRHGHSPHGGYTHYNRGGGHARHDHHHKEHNHASRGSSSSQNNKPSKGRSTNKAARGFASHNAIHTSSSRNTAAVRARGHSRRRFKRFASSSSLSQNNKPSKGRSTNKAARGFASHNTSHTSSSSRQQR